MEHRNVVTYLHAFFQEFNINSMDVGIQLASYSFDLFVEEVFPILLKGGKIVIRMLSLTTAFAGIAGGVVQYLDYKSAKERFDDIDEFSDEDKMEYTSEDWERAKENTNNHLMYGYMYGGIALLGVSVFAISFAF